MDGQEANEGGFFSHYSFYMIALSGKCYNNYIIVAILFATSVVIFLVNVLIVSILDEVELPADIYRAQKKYKVVSSL